MLERLTLPEAMIVGLIGAVSALVCAILSLIALNVSSSRERDAKMVEIAIGVLRAEPKPEVLAPRSWAVRVINSSSVPLTKSEAEELLKNAVPYVPRLDFSDPRNSQYLPGR